MPRRNDVPAPVVAPVDLFPVTRYVIWISHLLHVSIQKAPRTASLASRGRTPPPASADPAPVDVYPPAPEIPELVRPESVPEPLGGAGCWIGYICTEANLWEGASRHPMGRGLPARGNPAVDYIDCEVPGRYGVILSRGKGRSESWELRSAPGLGRRTDYGPVIRHVDPPGSDCRPGPKP